MPVADAGPKSFPGAGTKKGVEVWRIEVEGISKISCFSPILKKNWSLKLSCMFVCFCFGKVCY